MSSFKSGISMAEPTVCPSTSYQSKDRLANPSHSVRRICTLRRANGQPNTVHLRRPQRRIHGVPNQRRQHRQTQLPEVLHGLLELHCLPHRHGPPCRRGRLAACSLRSREARYVSMPCYIYVDASLMGLLLIFPSSFVGLNLSLPARPTRNVFCQGTRSGSTCWITPPRCYPSRWQTRTWMLWTRGTSR